MLSTMARVKLKEMGESEDLGVLFVRNVPKDLTARLKAVAALNRQTLGQYILELLTVHLQELEKKGHLPRGK
jgi:hypothetical protein